MLAKEPCPAEAFLLCHSVAERRGSKEPACLRSKSSTCCLHVTGINPHLRVSRFTLSLCTFRFKHSQTACAELWFWHSVRVERSKTVACSQGCPGARRALRQCDTGHAWVQCYWPEEMNLFTNGGWQHGLTMWEKERSPAKITSRKRGNSDET